VIMVAVKLGKEFIGPEQFLIIIEGLISAADIDIVIADFFGSWAHIEILVIVSLADLLIEVEEGIIDFKVVEIHFLAIDDYRLFTVEADSGQ
jgi:hypothetical protein